MREEKKGAGVQGMKRIRACYLHTYEESITKPTKQCF
jgi:hypothetical protein